MARIAVITHQHDNFLERAYTMCSLVRHWISAGHEVLLVAGICEWPDADVAVLHVDLSVIPKVYSDACKRYPVVINGAVNDIRKTHVSRHLLAPGDDWPGPVIVKTNLNCAGLPEQRLAKITGSSLDLPSDEIISTSNPYPILESLSEVPDEVWRNPGLVVEKFLPEHDAKGYWMQTWVFLGDQERCTRFQSDVPVLKNACMHSHGPAVIPDSVRAERERLRFDYGKFDFVIHDGEAITLDANRTPYGPRPGLMPNVEASNAMLSRGIEFYL